MAVLPGGVVMGRPYRIAVPGLAVDALTLVPVHGVIANQQDGTVGGEVIEHEPYQGAPEGQPGPRRTGQDSLVVGAMSGGEVTQGPEEIGGSATAGGQHRSDKQRQEPLVSGVGEVDSQNLDQWVSLGW